MIKFLETDEEFIQLIPLIVAFSQKTGTPFWKNCYEVSMSFLSERTVTAFVQEEQMVAYGCGYFVTGDTFLFAQAFSFNPIQTPKGYKMIEDRAIELGAKKLLMFTQSDSKVFEKYGFNFDRYMLMKEV